MLVTGIYRGDAMLRQVSEAVVLVNAKVGTIYKTKKEWNYSPVESHDRKWRK